MSKTSSPAYSAAMAIAERRKSHAAVDQVAAAIHMEQSAKSQALAAGLTTYRLFCMDWFGKIMGIETIQAASDQEAVEIARALDLGIKCEVWDRQRLIARIERTVDA
jgi:hypothetical protein